MFRGISPLLCDNSFFVPTKFNRNSLGHFFNRSVFQQLGSSFAIFSFKLSKENVFLSSTLNFQADAILISIPENHFRPENYKLEPVSLGLKSGNGCREILSLLDRCPVTIEDTSTDTAMCRWNHGRVFGRFVNKL